MLRNMSQEKLNLIGNLAYRIMHDRLFTAITLIYFSLRGRAFLFLYDRLYILYSHKFKAQIIKLDS
jgi:hypothetical protein